MAKFSEETLIGWSKPARESEEQRISNSISMIKDAVHSQDMLKEMDIEPVVQGSYANNTNVRLDSDIDVCLMLKDTFYHEYPEGLSNKDYGFQDGSNNFVDYRKLIIAAMIAKFGYENVIVGNKSVKIKTNSYRVQADVVPAFQYRNYKRLDSRNPDNFIEGIQFFSADNHEMINYPKEHVKNGIDKNSKTQRRFKRTVRLYKRIRNKMIEEGIPVSNGITSFLLECLLWNVSNDIITSTSSWNSLLKATIVFLYDNTEDISKCKEWGEVSEHFYLFHPGRKWTFQNVNDFLVKMWRYLELGK